MTEGKKLSNWVAPDKKRLKALCQKCPPHIFRAYDIRGKTSIDLTSDVTYLIGRAIGSEVVARRQKTMVVGRDCRESSVRTTHALKAGLRESGIDVIDIGLVPTPVLYYSTWKLKTWSGVMVTGSHNPKEYNGLKILVNKESLSGDQISALFVRIKNMRFANGRGKESYLTTDGDYADEIVEKSFSHKRKLKVVIDAGNGMAGVLAPKIVRRFGHLVKELYCDIDGEFPNHHPDPSKPENLEVLRRTVSEENADIGLAFDGDGDRLGVVDGTGQIIWPDRQMIIFARDLLSRAPGSKVVYDVKCSRLLKDEVSKSGGIPVMSRTGHSFIKKTMLETGALLGGEMSGHFFLKERWYGFDDAICSAIRFLEILCRSEVPVGAILSSVNAGVSTPELTLNLMEGESHRIIRLIQNKASFERGNISTLDGLRVDFENSWGLVRASNTTPCLVFRFEGDDEHALELVQRTFRDLLVEIDSSLSLPF